jgi:hypothetical protein
MNARILIPHAQMPPQATSHKKRAVQGNTPFNNWRNTVGLKNKLATISQSIFKHQNEPRGHVNLQINGFKPTIVSHLRQTGRN